MKKNIRNKGFTLAETLLAIMILLMVSGIMASGIPTAINVYHKVVDAANANALISTTTTELRDRLALAKDVEVEGNTVKFTGSNGKNYELYLTSSGDRGLYVEDVTAGITGNGDSRMLVSDSAANKNLYVKYESVSVAADMSYIKFINLSVQRDDDSTVFDTIDEFDVKLINIQENDDES